MRRFRAWPNRSVLQPWLKALSPSKCVPSSGYRTSSNTRTLFWRNYDLSSTSLARRRSRFAHSRTSCAVRRGLSFDRIEWAARTTGWAVHTGVVLSEPGEDEIVRLEAEAITSLGPLTPSTELRALLTKLYPSLPEKLDGARERISRGGPDAVAQAATSLQEALDWTLRLLAPEGDVLAWHASERRLPSDLRNGHPTRPLRVRYIVRGHPEKQSSVGLYLKVLPELLQAIERHKHGLIQPPRRYMEPLAKMLESILQCLLTD